MMTLFANCGSSAAIACWQLNLQYVPRTCTVLAADTSRTSHVGGNCKMCSGGICFTSASWNDISESNQYKRVDVRVPKTSKSSAGICRLHSLGSYNTRLSYEPVTGSGNFHLILNVKIKRGFVIRCSIDVPVPGHRAYRKDSIENGEHSMNPSTGSETRTDARSRVKAAFFDVDGTITRTNVVLAYFFVRMSELSFSRKLFWVPCFAVLCILYLLVDNFDRATFNRIFYSNHYKGRSADSKSSMAALVYERYYKPRIFEGALEHIKELKQLDYRIVLVTGALDFQIAPLARELEADFVYAAELVEENGRFTGKLNGMATSNSEKAERVLDYSKRFGVSLEDSLAFGDSIADVSMLEMVGRPHAVNPDARLLAIAQQRKWTVLSWTLDTLKLTTAVNPLPG